MEKIRKVKDAIWDFLLDGMWLDGLRLFFACWRSWIRGAAAFAVAFFLVDYLCRRLQEPVAVPLVHLALYAALIYFFTVVFLRQEPVGGKAPAPAWKPFGFMLVYVLGLAVVDGLIRMGMADASILILIVKLVCAVAVFVLVYARLLLIAPLIANETTSPAMASLRLTERNSLRLIANIVILTIMLLPPGVVVGLTALSAARIIFDVFAVGVYAAFACAAYRILYGEDVAARLGYDRRAAKRD